MSPKTPFLISAALLVVGASCKTESSEPPIQDPTGTDGLLTGYVDEGGDGADETGASEFQGCVFQDSPGNPPNTFAHQCAAEYDVSLTFDFLDIFGNTNQHAYTAYAVQTLNESTYEHPMAAACCTDIETYGAWIPDGDTCALPHHEACYSDLIQHLCATPVAAIDKAMTEIDFANSILGEARAWFKDHLNDCYDHFWTGADALHEADYCTPTFDSFYDHPPWEPDVSFSVSLLPGTEELAKVSNFSLSPSTLFNTVGVKVLPADPSSCDGPVDNGGELPPLSDPSEGSAFTTLAANIPIDVVGPTWANEVITGTGSLGGDSWLAYEPLGSDLSIEGWTMFEAASTTVGTSTLRAGVSAFRVDQVGAVVASHSGGVFRVEAGDTLFHLAASVNEINDYVLASNSTPLEFYHTSGGVGSCPTFATTCLVSRPFTVSYTDVFGDDWNLDVGSATWIP